MGSSGQRLPVLQQRSNVWNYSDFANDADGKYLQIRVNDNEIPDGIYRAWGRTNQIIAVENDIITKETAPEVNGER